MDLMSVMPQKLMGEDKKCVPKAQHVTGTSHHKTKLQEMFFVHLYANQVLKPKLLQG